MAHFAAKKDSMSALISQSADIPVGKADTQMKHFAGAERGAAMESLLEQTGGPGEELGSKKQFAARGATAEAAFKPSIKLASKPEGHGNITAQEIAPSDLGAPHGGKRVFEDKSGVTESEPAEAPAPAKRPRTDLDDSAVRYALHPSEAPAPDTSATFGGMKKQVAGASNKRDRVLDGSDPAPCPDPLQRRHFAGHGNEADKMAAALEHPKSAKKAPRAPPPPPPPAPEPRGPAAGMTSASVNRDRAKTLANATNAMPAAGAGMTSAQINAPVKPCYAKAGAAGGAGMCSADIAKPETAVAPTSTTATSRDKAMNGSAAASCLSWN